MTFSISTRNQILPKFIAHRTQIQYSLNLSCTLKYFAFQISSLQFQHQTIPTMKTFQVLLSLTLLGVAVVNGQEEITKDNV
jgi:hypothetical protein